MSCGYAGLSSVTVSAVVARWFVQKRARALSLMSTGTSLGGVLLVPATTALIGGPGFAAATLALAVLAVGLVVPLALFVIRHDPAELGLAPDGYDQPHAPPRHSAALDLAFQRRVWTRREAAGTTAFWAITLAFGFVLVGQTAYLVHQISFLKTVIGKEQAALAVSVTAGASIVGRLIMGVYADRLDKRALAIGCVLVQSISLFVVAQTSSTALLYAGTLGIGLTMGNIYMMQSLLIGECFGLASFGTIFGLATVLAQIGSAAGPSVAGALFDATGSYRLSFVVLSTGGLIAAALILFARPAVGREAAESHQLSMAGSGR